jgi:glutamyl-tRNA synthetase
LPGLRDRARTIVELADNALLYAEDGLPPISAKARSVLSETALDRLRRLLPVLERQADWTAAALEVAVRDHIATATDDPPAKLGDLAQPLRAALTGATVSPPIFDVMETLGRDLSLVRLAGVLQPGKSVEETTARTVSA